MKINVLPLNIAEKIAAGEVVERPSSVVKELVENAIDAEATAITIEIKNGGTTYIRVTDNGMGMNAEDAERAFLRHATSKIAVAEDLEKIATMGFRGEALFAICAVSNIELRTKERESEKGTQVNISGGVKQDSFTASMQDGTSIVVTDLFFNTPARMKFLKTNRTEAAKIEDLVSRIALAKPEIAIKLSSDGVQKIATTGNGDLKQVVYAIYGADYAKSLMEVDYTYEGLRVRGVIGGRETHRGNRNQQTFFVNGRYVKSGLVANAVEEAHKNKIMTGMRPFFVLGLEIGYGEIDINVHPAKTEVKFAEEGKVYKAIYWAVKNALEGGRVGSSQFEFTREEPVKVEAFTPIVKAKPRTYEVNLAQESFEIVVPPARVESSEEVVVENPAPRFEYSVIGQAFKTYIIIEYNGEMVFIDQHAAHERRIFERLLADESMESQVVMDGMKVDLTKQEMGMVAENLEKFSELGFEIDAFGEAALMVRTTPITLPMEELKDVILEIAEKIDGNAQSLTPKVREEALHMVACKSAIKGNRVLYHSEIEDLVNWVLGQGENQTCPHGRPLVVKFSKGEIERMFKRS